MRSMAEYLYANAVMENHFLIEDVMSEIVPVILCGGSGTRLWPLSRGLYPKQFVDLGCGETLFKNTLLRASRILDRGEPIFLCNDAYRFYVSTDIAECGMCGRIILEPAPRNTAPAIALAAHAALEKNENSLLLVMPADHSISDAGTFASAIAKASPLAASGHIVTFGIMPTSPETGFGYIQQGSPLGEAGFSVRRFVEKPDGENAQRMIDEGGFFWNSGIFLMPAALFLRELHAHAPKISEAIDLAWKNRKEVCGLVYPESQAFLSCPEDSIDYAVMEHTSVAAVCPISIDWNDLDSWESFYQIGEKDQEGNVCSGDVLALEARNCYLHGTHRLVAALDVDNLAVIETQDAILVASRNSLQKIKGVVGSLKAAGRPECRLHPRVFRPWGSYEALAMGDRFQVKRIIVAPGEELSLQMHYHRAEHWVVVSGTAEITNGETVGLYNENQSTYIPVGTMHRLKNPGTIPLILIETQSGPYLGEDDIVRFDDNYGRVAQTDSVPTKAPEGAVKDVVILSSADWDNPFWTNKQHMAVQFAEHGWRVLYVDSLGLRQPTLHKKDLFRIARRLFKSFPWPRKMRPNIWRVSPLVLPFHKYSWVRGLNAVILRVTLRLHMFILGIKKPLLWTYNPLLSDLCAKLPHCGVVYHCVDDLRAAPRIDNKAISTGEAEMAKVADMCFTTSPALQERMRTLFKNSVFEPNVCDYDLFRSAMSQHIPEPLELVDIPHPRLLFIGALSEYKVDFDLIEKVAKLRPDLHWVLVGAQGEGQPESRSVPDLPNLHVLGPKPYNSLPGFMRHADVAVMPSARNTYTASMFPMKFFEYLAAGLQVVGTRLPSIEGFRDLYFPVDGVDEFCKAVDEVLAGAQCDAGQIDAACRHNCWAARFGRMEAALNRFLVNSVVKEKS